VGLILDLAVAALALVVIGSLATLAWTLAVSAVRATSRGRERVAATRRSVVDAEERLVATSARTIAVLADASARTAPRPPDRYDRYDRSSPTGEPPDA
jgi:hypothetical protein